MEIDLLITGKFLLTITNNEIIKDGAVGIKKDRIVWVGSYKKIDAELHWKELLDFGFSIILPGFVNTHTHSAMVGMRGIADDQPLGKWLNEHIWPFEKRYVNRDFIKTMVPLAICEMIKSGTTTFADMYFFEDETAKIAKNTGIRAILGEGIIDYPTPSAKTPEEGLRLTRKLIETWKGNDYIYPAVAPHAPYSCSGELLRESREISEEFDVPCMIHIAETKEEVDDITSRYRMTPVQYLDNIGFLSSKTVGAHCVWLTDNDIDIFWKRDVGVSHNPESNLKLASGIAPVKKYIDKGLKIGLGTDGAASNNNLDMMEEMHTAALIHKVIENVPTVLKAEDVVYMATMGGAKVLGLGDEIGSIEIGKKADIIIVGLDEVHLTPIFNPFSHLVYCAKSSDIDTTLIGGNIVMKDRILTTLDEKSIKEDAREYLREK